MSVKNWELFFPKGSHNLSGIFLLHILKNVKSIVYMCEYEHVNAVAYGGQKESGSLELE